MPVRTGLHDDDMDGGIRGSQSVEVILVAGRDHRTANLDGCCNLVLFSPQAEHTAVMSALRCRRAHQVDLRV